MNVTVVGGGYVGLISAVCFCEFGFNVCVVEQDPKRLEGLKIAKSTVYEPGLDQILHRNIESKKLTFSADLSDVAMNSDAIVIAVPTSSSVSGDADSDLTRLNDTIKTIASALVGDKYTGIFIKSSVPVGTCSIILDNIKFIRPDLILGKNYDIIANPSFLREGTAIKDFMHPSAILLGLNGESPNAKELIKKLYDTLLNLQVPFIYANFETIELARSSLVALAATKMAFINEIKEICERTDADVNKIIKILMIEQKFGSNALLVSPGIGGSSFPRTMRILLRFARSLGIDLKVLDGVINSNLDKITKISERILKLIADDEPMDFKKVTILGLTYKPQTNDIKESASLIVVEKLLNAGVSVYAYDPAYEPDSDNLYRIPKHIMKNAKFHLTRTPYEAAMQSNILVIMTSWAEFNSLNYEKIKELMCKNKGSNPIIMDYKNLLS